MAPSARRAAGFIWPGWTVNWANFSNVYAPHTAVELACGTVPPLALLAGLFGRRGEFVRRMKWELGLLALVLVISMLPSANVFRWSFRWLPLIHLVLALVAAEALTATPPRHALVLAGHRRRFRLASRDLSSASDQRGRADLSVRIQPNESDSARSGAALLEHLSATGNRV